MVRKLDLRIGEQKDFPQALSQDNDQSCIRFFHFKLNTLQSLKFVD